MFIMHSEAYHSLAIPHFFLAYGSQCLVTFTFKSMLLASIHNLLSSNLKIALLTLLKRRSLHVAININIHLHVHMYT